MLDLNQRRTLQQLTLFAAQTGPAVQQSFAIGVENSLMLSAIVEAVRRVVCPEVPGDEWCETVNAVRTEIMAAVSIGNAARACGSEAAKAQAWQESLA